jgi:hypothetical protein
MLKVGEETGQTDTILVKVADFYEEEVDVVVNSLSSILEPIMICVMGGMVGLNCCKRAWADNELEPKHWYLNTSGCTVDKLLTD